jgi:hypothetical protein
MSALIKRLESGELGPKIATWLLVAMIVYLVVAQ